jgi:Flp pilus assembly protein TadD
MVGSGRDMVGEEELVTGAQPSPEALDAVAWALATGPCPRVCDPRRAVTLARKSVALEPKNSDFWNTLGVAKYRAGDWKGAVEALARAAKLRKEGDDFTHLFLAMAHWQLGEKEKARACYDKAVAWAEKNHNFLAVIYWHLGSKERAPFRAEAAALLGVKGSPPEKAAPAGK